MLTTFHLDWETRSELDLEEVGLDKYMSHPSTEIIMANYAEGDHKVKRWEPHLSPKIPNELYDALTDPFVFIEAWNAQFERIATNKILNICKPASEFRCTMVKARYLSLPGSLEAAGEILNLKDSEKKLDGDKLIQKFCLPEFPAGRSTLFGPSKASYRDWNTDPEDWEKFCVYGGQDVVAERIIGKKLDKFPVPAHEWDTYVLDQKINDTGWPLDMATVRGARFIVEKELGPLIEQIISLSGVKNPSSPKQLLAWLGTQGYSFSSLGKTFVNRALTGESDLTEAARKVLEIRAQTSKTSVNKYTVLADLVGEDGRLRHQYQFMGASRTHRWCLAENTSITVKIEIGVVRDKPIQDVLLSDLVWDGEDWVTHEGVVFSGDKEVVSWDGITATSEHEVWVSPDKKMTLGDAHFTYTNLWKGKPDYEIYRATSPSGKFYIGLTSMGVPERWRKHILRSEKKINHPFYNAIRKYGHESFVLEVIDYATSVEKAKELEIKHIADSPEEKLYNLSPGGEHDGSFGSKLFWERLNADPEAREKYINILSEDQKSRGADAHKHLAPAGQMWRKNHPRKAYEIVRTLERKKCELMTS